jgi:hypothetical protein
MDNFWDELFMKKVRIKSSGETGTIIDVGSEEGTCIVEVDSPSVEEIYPLRDCRLEELIFEKIAV